MDATSYSREKKKSPARRGLPALFLCTRTPAQQSTTGSMQGNTANLPARTVHQHESWTVCSSPGPDIRRGLESPLVSHLLNIASLLLQRGVELALPRQCVPGTPDALSLELHLDRVQGAYTAFIRFVFWSRPHDAALAAVHELRQQLPASLGDGSPQQPHKIRMFHEILVKKARRF